MAIAILVLPVGFAVSTMYHPDMDSSVRTNPKRGDRNITKLL